MTLSMLMEKIRISNRKRNYLKKHILESLRINLVRVAFDKNSRDLFPNGKIEKILLVRNEGAIGDLVVDSALVKVLHDNGYIVDFLVTKGNCESIRYNPYIRNFYESVDVSSDNFIKSFSHNVPRDVMVELTGNGYDLLVDPSLGRMPIHRLKMINEINPRNVIGFNKRKSINIYNKNFDFNTHILHVSEASMLVCKSLGIELHSEPKYDIHLPSKFISDVSNIIPSNDGLVVINIHASNEERCISLEQLSSLLDLLNENFKGLSIVLLDHKKEIDIQLPSNVVINPFPTIHHAIALLYKSYLIISPDTSIVHYAASWNKNLIAIYRDIPSNNNLWAPRCSNASQMILPVRSISSSPDLPNIIVSEIRRRGLL